MRLVANIKSGLSLLAVALASLLFSHIVSARYVQSDPVGLDGGLNTFEYVDSNPMRYVDLLGLGFISPDFIPNIFPDITCQTCHKPFIPPPSVPTMMNEDGSSTDGNDNVSNDFLTRRFNIEMQKCFNKMSENEGRGMSSDCVQEEFKKCIQDVARRFPEQAKEFGEDAFR